MSASPALRTRSLPPSLPPSPWSLTHMRLASPSPHHRGASRRSVADLSLFCEKCLQPLRASRALSKDQEAAVFSNWEVIRGVNQQLLDALSVRAPLPATSRSRPHSLALALSSHPLISPPHAWPHVHPRQAPVPEDPLVRAAAAFESIAPWLKTYSVYCASFVTAQEKLDRLRGESAEVDKACGAVEDLIHATISSMLIKPVQRLCKYPLLFRELLHEIPDEHPHRALVLSAARTVTAIAAEVNEAVRCPPPLPPAPKPCPPHPRQPPNQSQTHSLPLHPPPYTLRPPPSTLHPPPSTLRPPPSGRCARRSDVTTS